MNTVFLLLVHGKNSLVRSPARIPAISGLCADSFCPERPASPPNISHLGGVFGHNIFRRQGIDSRACCLWRTRGESCNPAGTAT